MGQDVSSQPLMSAAYLIFYPQIGKTGGISLTVTIRVADVSKGRSSTAACEKRSHGASASVAVVVALRNSMPSARPALVWRFIAHVSDMARYHASKRCCYLPSRVCRSSKRDANQMVGFQEGPWGKFLPNLQPKDPEPSVASLPRPDGPGSKSSRRASSVIGWSLIFMTTTNRQEWEKERLRET